jgi:hypothetical protein
MKLLLFWMGLRRLCNYPVLGASPVKMEELVSEVQTLGRVVRAFRSYVIYHSPSFIITVSCMPYLVSVPHDGSSGHTLIITGKSTSGLRAT